MANVLFSEPLPNQNIVRNYNPSADDLIQSWDKLGNSVISSYLGIQYYIVLRGEYTENFTTRIFLRNGYSSIRFEDDDNQTRLNFKTTIDKFKKKNLYYTTSNLKIFQRSLLIY